MDTLALGYTLPDIGRVTDLYRLENVCAGEQKKTTNYPIVSGLYVEHSGLEPLTSTLPVSRSSQMS